MKMIEIQVLWIDRAAYFRISLRTGACPGDTVTYYISNTDSIPIP